MQETKSAYQQVIDYIKSEIRSGNLKVGSLIPPERTLAELLSVSRNSVREAIRVMEIMGTVESVQGAGHYISNNFETTLIESMSMLFMLDEYGFKEISELRRALEKEAFILAVENAGKKDIDTLKEIDMKLDRTELSEKENIMLDKKLHYAVAKASGNKLILSVLDALSEIMDRFIAELRSEIMASEDNKEKLTKAHRRIVSGIISKDVSDGLSALEEHFRLIDESLKKN